MADPVRVESLDAIPEGIRPHFVEVKGEGDAVAYEYRPPREDTSGLKSALGKKSDALKKAEAELAAYRERFTIDGKELDADELKVLLEARDKAREGETISRADAEKEKAALKAKLEELYGSERTKWTTENADLRAALDKVLIDVGVQNAVNSPDAPVRIKPEAVEDLLTYVRVHKLVKVAGDSVEVFELDGKTPLTNAKGEPGTLADLIALVAGKKPHWVVESQGTGSQPPLNGSAPRKKKSEMSMDEKIDFIKKYGEEKYAALAV